MRTILLNDQEHNEKRHLGGRAACPHAWLVVLLMLLGCVRVLDLLMLLERRHLARLLEWGVLLLLFTDCHLRSLCSLRLLLSEQLGIVVRA